MGSEKVDWAINGELALNCNCTVFCPCAVSLGDHPPTEGYCQTWLAVRIDHGHFRDVDLSGLNVGMLMEIPGKMARGNWTIGAFIDDSAGDEAFDALDKIFSGKVGGTTGLFSISLVDQASFEPATSEVFQNAKLSDGEVECFASHHDTVAFGVNRQLLGQGNQASRLQFWFSHGGASKHTLDPGHQDPRAEGLRDVIIGS